MESVLTSSGDHGYLKTLRMKVQRDLSGYRDYRLDGKENPFAHPDMVECGGQPFFSPLHARVATYITALGCVCESFASPWGRDFKHSLAAVCRVADFPVDDDRSIDTYIVIKKETPTVDEINLLRAMCCADQRWGFFANGSFLQDVADGLLIPTSRDRCITIAGGHLRMQYPMSVFGLEQEDGHAAWPTHLDSLDLVYDELFSFSEEFGSFSFGGVHTPAAHFALAARMQGEIKGQQRRHRILETCPEVLAKSHLLAMEGLCRCLEWTTKRGPAPLKLESE